jgi:hypothetical protein
MQTVPTVTVRVGEGDREAFSDASTKPFARA